MKLDVTSDLDGEETLLFLVYRNPIEAIDLETRHTPLNGLERELSRERGR